MNFDAENIICAILIAIIIYLFWRTREYYRGCRDVDDCVDRPLVTSSVLNPYKWPFNSSICPEHLLLPNSGVSIGSITDHEIYTS